MSYLEALILEGKEHNREPTREDVDNFEAFTCDLCGGLFWCPPIQVFDPEDEAMVTDVHLCPACFQQHYAIQQEGPGV